MLNNIGTGNRKLIGNTRLNFWLPHCRREVTICCGPQPSLKIPRECLFNYAYFVDLTNTPARIFICLIKFRWKYIKLFYYQYPCLFTLRVKVLLCLCCNSCVLDIRICHTISVLIFAQAGQFANFITRVFLRHLNWLGKPVNYWTDRMWPYPALPPADCNQEFR